VGGGTDRRRFRGRVPGAEGPHGHAVGLSKG